MSRESTALREKRLELKELEGAQAFWGPEAYGAMRQALLDDIAELEAQPAAPAPAPSPMTPAAPAAPEKPMSTPQPSPEARLGQLMTRLHENAKTGTVAAASLTRVAIRKHCAAHGLPVPEEAQIRRDCAPLQYRKSAAKAPATAPKASASPGSKAAKRAGAPSAQGAAQPSAQVGPGHDLGPTHPLPPGIIIQYGELPDPALRLQGIRRLALDLLPELESLTPEQARAAHYEMDLLAQALVLGGKLIARRVA